MSFLTPFFLLGGLAIAGPIIYHLVRRATRERTRFSSLMFLLPSPPRLSKRHRLEHLLLLILRCVALALLALGFARPFFRQAPITDPSAAQPKRILVLVDTSASMRRDGVWAAARERVNDVLRRAGPADHAAVYVFDQKATALLSFEDWNRAAPDERVALANSRLAATAPGWAGTHLGNALITAAEAVGESDDGKNAPGPRQIVLVSDVQAGSRLGTLQAYEWPKGLELQIEAVKAKSSTNAGVQFVAEGPDSTRAVDAPVRVRVTNASDSKREQFNLGWTRPATNNTAGEFVGAAIDAYVPPGQSRVFALPLPQGQAGLEQVTLRGDDEDFDNTAYVIPPAQQRTRVLWLGSDVAEDSRQPLFFLRRAFTETPRVSVQVQAVAPNAPLARSGVSGATLVFVTDPISAEAAAALREQALAGKTIVAVPKSAALAPTLGALLGTGPVPMSEVKPDRYAMFADIDFQHPLFAPFADPRFSDFTKIHFWKYRKLDVSGVNGARILAKFDSGDPALVEVPLGRGRLFLLASGWQPDDSQLSVSSKFVPLLWSLLEQSGGVGNFTPQYTVGEPVVLPPGFTATTVRTPAGATATLADANGKFADTFVPGIYELTGGAKPQRFAVNVDANESRTAALAMDELEQLGLPVARTKTAPTETTENKVLLQGLEAENRQKLWRWFIAATLVLLLAESAIAGWTARRQGLQTEEVAT